MKNPLQMTEAEIDTWIAAALLDDLSPEERAAFDQHLAAQPASQARYQETATMTKQLKESLAPVRPDPHFENRLIHSFRERAKKNLISRLGEILRRSLRLPQVYVPAAAALLIALVQVGSLVEISRQTPLSVRKEKAAFALRSSAVEADSSFSKTDRDKNIDASSINENFQVYHRAGDGVITESAKAASTWTSVAADGTVTDHQMADGTIKTHTVGGSRSAIVDNVSPVGDIPLAGRLFRANAEPHIKQNLLEFAEADGPSVTTMSGSHVERHKVTEFSYPNATASAAPRNNPLDRIDVSGGVVERAVYMGKSGQTASAVAAADTSAIDNRKLIRDASLDLEVKNYDTALDAITALATANSGYVATKDSARLPNGKMSGTVVIKVTPDHLDAALLQIRALGDLKNQSLSTQDVTKEYFDTDARLRNARMMEGRLLALLDTMKGKITDLLAVEKELARVREQIEQMQGELKLTDSLVQYATITISLREKDLHEAAAYLLNEQVALALFSPDVDKTCAAIRAGADGDKIQIVHSDLQHDDSGRVTATMSFLLAPETADQFIARAKGLGRVQNFNVQDQRVAQDGSENSTTARVERAKVRLDLTVSPDDDARKQVSLIVVTPQVEAAFEAAKAAATAQGATILNSDLQHNADDSGTTATVAVRVPAAAYQTLLEAFRKAGLVSQFVIQRDDSDGAAPGPVLITFTLTDANQPVQFSQVAVLTHEVEAQADRLKKAAADRQVQIKTSTFEHTADGFETANFVFRLPLEKYPSFLAEIQSLGQVKELSVHREDHPENSSTQLAIAEISLRLYSQGNVVSPNNGLLSTLRQTLGEGVGALMWSLRMIGVAVAFLAPWMIALGLTVWIVRRVRRRK